MYKNICRHTSRIRKTSAAAAATVTASSPNAAASGAPLRLQVATNITQPTTTTTSLVTTKPVSPRIDDVRYFTTAAGATSRLTSQQQPLGKYSEGQLLEYDASPSLLISFVRTMASGSKPPQESAASQPKHTNRLAMEKSPYLLQHAHNPVDWYPWCEEAFEKARAENKLIFLSVGYSTCHWCHVMEHESFEDEEVAELMNQHFVNIKVDREERPDIDQIYMQFLLAVNNNGGWPMSVWLTPELTPVMAGTYFPPHNRWGMLSFKNVLNLMARQWQENRDKLTTTGNEIVSAMQRSMEGAKAEGHEPAEVETRLEESIAIFRHRFDSVYGGFGTKPKFPEVSRLNLLFHAYVITKDQDVLDMVLTTLRRIGNGGIHDHVFGGFARYSVDRTWHIPHFEKMLYDQGQLMSSYANAYMVTRTEEFLERGDGIFEYMMKDLRHPRGGFYAGEDADSLPSADAAAKVEGAFYAWTWQEIKDAMCQRPDLYKDIPADKAFVIYSYHYDLKPHGNVAPADDPHGHLTKKNILFVHDSLAETCTKFKITEQQLRHILETTNKVLHEIRDQRPRPHLDTKIICSWNGLVLSGLSKLANCGSPRKQEYLKAAKELVDFLKKYLYDDEKKILLRSSYGLGTNDETLDSAGQERIEGFLVDYAFLIRGLLDYYKASLNGSALQWAKELQDTQDRLFWDSKDSAYFYSHENAPNIIVRLKEESDGAEPSGNSVSAHNLIMLAHYFDDESYKQRSEQLFQYFSGFQHFGHAFPEMMSALMLHDRGLDLVALVGPESEETQRFADICRKYYIPGMIIVHVDPEHQDENAYNIKVQDKFKMINGKPTVYICHDKVCRMPETDPEKLEAHLKQNYLNITGQ